MMSELVALRGQVDASLRALPVVRDILNRKVPHEAYRRYLASVANQYSPHSPIVMCQAASRLLNKDPELGKYLMQHATEEYGHNKWAFDDLLEEKLSEQQIRDAEPVPACAAMIGYIYYLANFDNPVGLFGWMYILEAVGADLGPDAVTELRHEGKPVRFVAGHATADTAHAAEIETMIERHVKHAADQRAVLHAAKVSADLYVRMFEQSLYV
jgi:hypothetical protein